MKNRFSVFVLALTLSTIVHAGPKEDAQAAYDKFFTSFVNNNQDQIAALFAPDALFYGTSSTDLVTAHEGVRAYFTRALTNPAVVKATPLGNTALVLNDDTVAISGKWQSERTLDGKTTVNGPLRNTVVMQKRGGQWMIVQFHNSPAPKQ